MMQHSFKWNAFNFNWNTELTNGTTNHFILKCFCQLYQKQLNDIKICALLFSISERIVTIVNFSPFFRTVFLIKIEEKYSRKSMKTIQNIRCSVYFKFLQSITFPFIDTISNLISFFFLFRKSRRSMGWGWGRQLKSRSSQPKSTSWSSS